jgi:tetratricopeptide (TPR) repeat protein
MNAKITWFEELLAAEPNSKFFFPLAQAYVQTGRDADAIAVLRKGLSFHPEHLEARLLLIQCLERGEDRSLALAQVEQLATSLAACPSFWNLWAEQSKTAGRDSLGLTLGMLSGLLQGTDLNWGRILESGLRAMSDPGPQSEVPHPEQAPSSPARTDTDSPSEQQQGEQPGGQQPGEQQPDARQPSGDQPPGQQAAEQHPDGHVPAPPSPDEPAPASADMPSPPTQPRAAATDADEEPAAAAHDSASDLPSDGSLELSEGERRYYETKTYAQLLADQGESAEALDLYTKLLQSTPDETQRQELEDRINQLRETLANKATGQPQDTSSTQQADQSGKQQPEQSASKPKAKAPPASDTSSGSHAEPKTRDKGAAKTLDRLARRLEARARSKQ